MSETTPLLAEQRAAADPNAPSTDINSNPQSGVFTNPARRSENAQGEPAGNTATGGIKGSSQAAATGQDPNAQDNGDGDGEIGQPIWLTRQFMAGFVITILVVLVSTGVNLYNLEQSDETRRNLVFMVSDGMGPASMSLTRSFRQHVENLPIDDTLSLDRHFWGTSRTRSSSSLVTDSAAGATAFSCGLKSYNGAIGVLPDYSPCGTVLEAAKREGYMTGLVVTTDITDATPACFASHVLMRTMMDEIAMQEVGEGPLGRVVDLMLGGGRCHFLPNSTEGSCRADDHDVVAFAKKYHGWSYSDSRKGFDAMAGGENVQFPMLGLFAERDIPFELDRQKMTTIYPSLSEMASTALKALEEATKDSDKGFFLMIEGSRIDHAGHINDPAAQVREVLEYDKTFQLVLDFLEKSDAEGLVVSTSDHETGGLSVALQEPGHYPVYKWYPEALANASSSAEYLHSLLDEHIAANAEEDSSLLRAWINEHIIRTGLGIVNPKPSELDELVNRTSAATNILADMVSLRAHVGWATHGHSAVDVNIYSSGNGADALRGNVENTDVGKLLAEYLGVGGKVGKITEELRKKMDPKRDAPQDVREMAEQDGCQDGSCERWERLLADGA